MASQAKGLKNFISDLRNAKSKVRLKTCWIRNLSVNFGLRYLCQRFVCYLLLTYHAEESYDATMFEGLYLSECRKQFLSNTLIYYVKQLTLLLSVLWHI